jgi:hypothetical protein
MIISVDVSTGIITERPLTADELEEIANRPPPTPPSPEAEIDRLERETLLPRPVRDVLLALMVKEAAALGLDEATLYSANPGYRRVKDLDTQIGALRALIK